jgi:filamentous hemagglutinin
MNKHSFRTIFNAKRGMLMAVSEAATSNGKSANGEGVSEGGSSLGAAIGAMLLAAMPLTGIAQIIADPSAPRNQQAIILPAGNGVPIVNIVTPTAGGVSMNMFNQFNVNSNGAILNNGRLNTQTQLAGWIVANPNLATGSASVIVNQVNSNNPTLLNGYIEVAGQRAQVIIANPSGIQVNGAGFINAQSATLTTGTPNFNGNVITGYTVNQGTIQINGAGLDASTTDYTAILARAAQINAGIWAKQLDVVTGANQINVSSVGATPTGISAATPTGAAPFFAIDVSSLGGMYAGKIMLIGTEAGLGFKNTGTIMGTNASLYAGAGEVHITMDGILMNSGQIQSNGNTTISLGSSMVGALNNTGTIYAGGASSITTNGNITNTAVIAAQGNLALAANGVNSNINSTSSSILAAGISSSGTLGTADASTGNLNITATNGIEAHGQILAAQNLNLTAQAINLTSSSAYGNNLAARATNGQIEVTGANVTAAQNMLLSASGNVFTNSANVTASNLQVTGANLTNTGGQIQANTANFSLAGGVLNNSNGYIYSAGAMTVTAATLDNHNTNATNKGIDTGALNATLGTQFNNTNGTTHAAGSLLVTTSGLVDNTAGNLSAGGNLTLTDSAATANNNPVKTLTVTNTNGTIASGRVLTIDASTESGDGKLNGQDITLKLLGDHSVSATSEIASSGNTNITVSGLLTNRGLIDGANTFVTSGDLTNLGTGRIYGDQIGIATNNLTNTAETLVVNGSGTTIAATIAARNRLDIGASNITNSEHGLLFSDGDMSIGGALDVNRQATGQAQLLRNGSANIEATGSIFINAANISNINDHFAYSIQLVNTTTNIYEAPYSLYYRIFDRYTYEPVVTSSDPSSITAGGSITLSGTTITNQQSKIIAGGSLTATGTTINNTQITDQRRVNDVGTQWSWGVTGGHDDCWPCHWVLDWGMVPSAYNVNTYTTLPVAGGVSPQGTNPASAAGQTVSTIFAKATVTDILSLASKPSVTPVQATNSTSAAWSGKSTSAITVPNNSLFRTPSNINATYLIETDPQFANYKTWLSSDYLLAALSYDPVTQQKRLGDGFYEQRLIREQISTLTGQRFLAGYQSEEEEYRALMDNAITVAKQFNLRPGIALTAEQVAQLTSDIVWLVSETVTLPNGTTTTALVPHVYAKLRAGDLAADGKLLGGSLLSGNSVSLETSGNITNGGTILGRKLVLMDAANISNSNAIQGATIGLTAKLDIDNIGGKVTATGGLYLDAGRNINVVSTTNSTTAGSHSQTTLDRVAGLYVTGTSGQLIANAGANITLTGAVIQSAGSAQLTTTNGSINLNALNTSSSERFSSTGEANFHQFLSATNQTGNTISTGGNLTMYAGGGNVIGVASNISAGGTATIAADEAVVLTEGRNTKDEDLQWTATSRDLLSKTSTTTTIQSSSDTATGNTLSGVKGVTVSAGGQLILNAINVTSTAGNISVTGSEVSITSGVNSTSSSREEDKQKSGLSLSDLTGLHNPTEGINAKKNTSDAGGSTTLVQSTLTGQNVQVTATGTPSYNVTTSNATSGVNTTSIVPAVGGNITLGAVAITATGAGSDTTNSTGNLNLNAVNGTLAFTTVQTTNFTSHAETKSDVFFQSAKGEGSQNQNTSYTTIQGNLAVTANRITIQGVSPSLNAAVNDVSSQPGMEWIKQLATDPQFKDKIDWTKVDEIHKTWNYDQFGLSKAGATVLAIVVTYFSAGTATGWANAAVGSLELTGLTATITSAAMKAGIIALANQFSVAMINNQGNLNKALDAMGQSANVKGLLTSMATAGALAGLPSILPPSMQSVMGATAQTSTLWTQLQQQLINNVASSVVGAAINGTSLEEGLKGAVSTALLNTIAAQGANAIGVSYSKDEIDKFTQMFAHAALGCAVGAGRTSGASGQGGCSAGALGAVIGELAADFFDPEKFGKVGVGSTSDFSGMMAAIAVALNGGNPAQINIANAAAKNAVENNQSQALNNVGKQAYRTNKTNALQACESKPTGCSETEYRDLDAKALLVGAAAERYDRIQRFGLNPQSAIELGNFLARLTPAGGGIAAIEAITGKNMLTDEDLSTFERVLSGAAAIVQTGSAAAGIRAMLGETRLLIADLQWGKGIMAQGMPWENYLATQPSLGTRLPPNFKTFDFFDEISKTATSAKTLDTASAARVANPESIYYTLKGYVDKMEGFSATRLSGVPLSPDMISSMSMQLAIPATTNAAGMAQITRAIEYASQHGVSIVVTRVK